MLRRLRKKAKKFLAENKTKEGVITTESGLQYKVEKKVQVQNRQKKIK